MKTKISIDYIADNILSEKAKERSEKITLVVAIFSYIAHLLLILLVNQKIIHVEAKLLQNPIAAIYTPFSFILVYEVYLLIYFLPKSFTTYIGKQYEIITLIVIRKIFKDIANLELHGNWFQSKNDLKFTYDVTTCLILFLLIYLFYRKSSIRNFFKVKLSAKESDGMQRFIGLKKLIAVCLLPVLTMLAIHAFYGWASETVNDYRSGIIAFENINNIFFDEFFTILIIIDVLLLLVSFFYSDEFHKIMRNSGFIISTTLIKISFSVEGLINNALIISAVLFGYCILMIHNLYEKNRASSELPEGK